MRSANVTFYEQTLSKLMEENLLSKQSSVLVVCGGPFDSRTMQAVGLNNVIVTNLDERYNGYCAPYAWDYADTENLKFADNSFDWVVQHAGLHHCESPHRGFLEMLRVARIGVLSIEARDSTLLRTAVRLGFTSDYEIESVALDPNQRGGQRNSGVPNFVYRWTEREVYKTVEAAYPDRKNDLRFFYGLSLPTKRLTMSGGIKRAAGYVLGSFTWVISKLVPRQGNQFAFVVLKGQKDKDWILRDEQGTRLDPNFRLGFDVTKYPTGGGGLSTS
jgi:SAM-dependent methyltransferase